MDKKKCFCFLTKGEKTSSFYIKKKKFLFFQNLICIKNVYKTIPQFPVLYTILLQCILHNIHYHILFQFYMDWMDIIYRSFLKYSLKMLYSVNIPETGGVEQLRLTNKTSKNLQRHFICKYKFLYKQMLLDLGNYAFLMLYTEGNTDFNES